MCGIVGIAGSLLYKDEATMKRLLLFDFLRGADGTGLAAIRNNGEIMVGKSDTDPIQLSYHKQFQDALDGNKSKVFIGHNRYATRGGKNPHNTHPFVFDHIVGAHNGTLDSASWKKLEDALGEKYSVDSQALIASIARFGIKATIDMCYEGKTSDTGAWSLVWYDQNEDSLNFLRNQHRPMWLAYEKDFARMFWASEWWMIQAAVLQSQKEVYELYTEGKEGYKFFPTDADVHYKFDAGALMGGSGGKQPKPKIQTIKGKEPPVAAVANQGNFPTRQSMGFGPTSNGGTGTHTGTSKKTSSRGKTTSQSSSPIHWLGKPGDPFAGYINEKQFKELAQYGCSWCSGDVEFTDPGVTIYERDNIVLCGDCSGHKELSEETPSRIYITGAAYEALR